MNSRGALTVITFFFFALSCLPFISLAQQSTQVVKISLSPVSPGPNEKVEVLLKNGTLDVSSLSSVVWQVNGKRVSTDTKTDRIEVVLGELGEVVVVVAEVEDVEGTRYTVRKSILPVAFDVLFEGDVYTPTGYQGRNVPAPQSEIRAAALISYIDEFGKKHTEDDFSLQWQFNDFPVEVNALNSSFVILPPLDYITSPGRVRIIATHKGQGFFLKKILRIGVYQPEIVLYENNPLYGLLSNLAVSSRVRISSATNVVAVPYFFDRDDVKNRRINYVWEEDSSVISSGVNAQYLRLNPLSDKRSARISLTARNDRASGNRKFLQSDKNSFLASL